MEEKERTRIMLLGKTGSGKSSLGNTILGEKELFKVSDSPNSAMKICESCIKEINGKSICLIDTPGDCDTDPRSSALSDEVLKCVEKCASGVHAFLLVLKVETFSVHERAVVNQIFKHFSDETLKFTTVAFTHGDNLPEGMTIKEWVRQNEDLRNLVQKCGGRCHVFDNKYWNNSQDEYRNNQNQVQELLRTMEETVRENRGGYYTNHFQKSNMARKHTSLRQYGQEPETRRIVLLGKTGAGKSSQANTLFGERNLFRVNHCAISGTKLCESKIKNINGRKIQLIYTPGLFDTDPRSSELSPEILNCITESAPGPHAFLLVLKVERFTKQEQAVVDLILKYFSEEALKYTTVVFTHGDYLPEGMKIEEWVRQNEDLRNLVQKCGGRCHVFDNKYWNNSQDQYRNNQYQVEELLRTIDQTVRENRGGFYTNKLLQMVQEEIQKEADCIKASASPKDSVCTIF